MFLSNVHDFIMTTMFYITDRVSWCINWFYLFPSREILPERQHQFTGYLWLRLLVLVSCGLGVNFSLVPFTPLSLNTRQTKNNGWHSWHRQCQFNRHSATSSTMFRPPNNVVYSPIWKIQLTRMRVWFIAHTNIHRPCGEPEASVRWAMIQKETYPQGKIELKRDFPWVSYIHLFGQGTFAYN